MIRGIISIPRGALMTHAMKLQSTARGTRFLSTCPVTGATSSTIIDEGTTVIRDGNPRPLSEMPGPKIYPIVGSIMDFKENGTSLYLSSKAYYKKYGKIVRQNVACDEVIIYDPREYIKVHRAEGKFPMAMASDFWPFKTYALTHKQSDLTNVGEPWKKIRTVLQPGILSPQVAASYLPSLNEVARKASEVFPKNSHDPHVFTARVAFDMFSAAMLGKSRGMLEPETACKEDHDFIDNSIASMRTAGLLVFDPMQGIMKDYIKTDQYKVFEKATEAVYARSFVLVDEAKLDLDIPGQEQNYLKWLLDSGNLSRKEASDEVAGFLLAAVDTTSNYMNWMMLNLARNPDKQKVLALELKSVLQGGDYTKELDLPYLNACYRECHRLTPVATGIYRTIDTDIVINDYLIPKGTRLSFNLESIQKDPEYVEDPDSFIPERWLSSAVEARKGTPSEVLDHKLLATPFSFGARMCLGGRLAEMEIKSLIARIVQDYEFTLSSDSPDPQVKEFLFLSPFPEPKFQVNARS